MNTMGNIKRGVPRLYTYKSGNKPCPKCKSENGYDQISENEFICRTCNKIFTREQIYGKGFKEMFEMLIGEGKN